MALTKVPNNLITADAIDGTLIADNAINSEHYTDGSIDTAHIAADQITSALIADDQIDSEHYVDGSIDLAHMSANSIDSNQYVDGSIDTAHIAADQITSALIADDQIDSEHYVDGSIDLAHMSANSVDSDQYVDGSIDNAHLADDAVGVAELSASGSASSSTFLRGDNSWTAVSTPITALNNATANELVTVGSTTTELDAESGLTWDTSTLKAAGNLYIGQTASSGVRGSDNRVQISGTDLPSSSLILHRYQANGYGPGLGFAKSRHGTVGSHTIVQDDDVLGFLAFYASDGNDFVNNAAEIKVSVDGTPGNNDTPGRITFGTTADGASSATERLRIDSAGVVQVVNSANVTQAALTSTSAAVAWDAATKANAYHLTTENTTFSSPSGEVEGAIISVEIAQGGTARTIAWHTDFEFAASTAPTITATANKTDILTFRYNGSVWQEIGRVQNMAQT